MSRELERVRNTLIPKQETEEAVQLSPLSKPEGFFTFRYSSTELFSKDGELHVKMRQARYQNGRLTSEECEGTVDRQAYNRMMQEAQGLFLGQAINIMRLVWAPFLSYGRRKE